MFRPKKPSSGRRLRTPSQAPKTLSYGYYSSGANSRPTPRPSKRRSWEWLKHLPSLLALVLIVVSMVYLSTLSSTPIVAIDQQTSLPAKGQGYYTQQVSSILGKSFWNGNKLTLDTAQVERQIRDKLPEIEDVSVKVPLVGRKPVIAIQLAEPAYILVPQLGNKFILDTTGRAIVDISSLRQPPKLLAISDQSGLAINPGQQILPGSTVDFITTFIQELAYGRVAVSSLVLPSVANQLNVDIAGQKYYIKTNLQGDARLQAGTYLAVAHKLKRTHIVPRQYVDVRVEQRAFYR